MLYRCFLAFAVLSTLSLAGCSKISYEAYSQDRKQRVSKSSSRSSARKSTYATKTRSKAKTTTRRSTVKHPAHIDNVQLRKAIVSDAQAHIGTQYVYGGKRPGGFDCSGFTSYVLSGNGVTLRGSSRDQSRVGSTKPLRELAPGDLAFFGSSGKVSHVGIVKQNTGDQLIVIHATSSNGVREDDVLGSNYWKSRLLFGRDVIR
jgi:cell wall-associated NlpC family hydrolase